MSQTKRCCILAAFYHYSGLLKQSTRRPCLQHNPKRHPQRGITCHTGRSEKENQKKKPPYHQWIRIRFRFKLCLVSSFLPPFHQRLARRTSSHPIWMFCSRFVFEMRLHEIPAILPLTSQSGRPLSPPRNQPVFESLANLIDLAPK